MLERCQADIARDMLAERLRDVFFGLGLDHWPYSPNEFESVVRGLSSLDVESPLPGHRAYCDELRQKWCRGLVFDGTDGDGNLLIPSKENVKVRSPCWKEHLQDCRCVELVRDVSIGERCCETLLERVRGR